MLIGARQSNSGNAVELPYDAEVEYLESTGTQWIDTGFVLQSSTFDFNVDFSLTRLYQEGENDIFGCYDYKSSYNPYPFKITSGILLGVFKQTNLAVYQSALTNLSSAATHTKYSVRFHSVSDAGYIMVNNVQTPFPFSGTWVRNGCHYGLFGNGCDPTLLIKYQNKPSSQRVPCARVFHFSILEDGVLKLDFIPVRIGSGANAVGYMYDRVSGTLFRNQGTGAFLIGPDGK